VGRITEQDLLRIELLALRTLGKETIFCSDGENKTCTANFQRLERKITGSLPSGGRNSHNKKGNCEGQQGQGRFHTWLNWLYQRETKKVDQATGPLGAAGGRRGGQLLEMGIEAWGEPSLTRGEDFSLPKKSSFLAT